MPNMTIKRWDTTANSGSGGLVEQYPKTVTSNIFDTNGTAVFETVGSDIKIKTEYLPNSVFDSLRFFGSLDVRSSNTDRVNDMIDVLKGIYDNANTNDRSAIGYYIVFSYDGTLAQANSNTAGAIATSFYGQFTYKHDDSSSSSATSVTVEAGDWAVIESASGTGTSSDPFIVTLSIISNTYELYQGATNLAAGSPGLVPAASSAQRLQFLRGDGTYATPTDTNTFRTVTAGGNTLDASETLAFTEGANVSISENAGAVTIAVTNESIEDVVGSMVVGNSESGISVTYQDTDGTLDFNVPEMVGGALNTAGTAGLAPAPGTTDFGKFLRGDATYQTPARRIVEINGTSEISSSGSEALDLKSALGIVVSAGSNTGEAEFKMQYPIAVSSSTPTDYQVANGMWFHI